MGEVELQKVRKISRRDLLWIIPSTITAGFFGWLAWRTYSIHFGKYTVTEPVWRDGPRIKAVSLRELGKTWDFKYFDYEFNGSPLKAVAFRLTEPVYGSLTVGEAHFLALSRICTHQSCIVNYVDNPELGAIAYRFRSDRPFMGCPCHFGAFDPLLAGKAIFGPPRHPLPRLRLEERAGILYATGFETPFRPLEQG